MMFHILRCHTKYMYSTIFTLMNSFKPGKVFNKPSRRFFPARNHFISGYLGIFAMAGILVSSTGNGIAGTHDAQIHEISGKTMGTFYHIKISAPDKIDRAIVKNQIDACLKAVNKSMSMYLKTSEISIFNQSREITPMEISQGFALVLEQARTLYGLTGGAWDGTIKPLVDLWGFGTKNPTGNAPDKDTIHRALAKTGFDKIILSEQTLAKKDPDISLDLGSIAKGYGVDQVASLLMETGFKNILVEIGGEVVGFGEKKPGRPWNVGIATPDKHMAKQTVYQAISLQDQALATSGDYRNFVVMNKKAYSHIIDPSTGYPVDNGVVSASVLADNCTFADGLATALMVMGAQKGIALVNRMADTECFIIVQEKTGGFKNWYSQGFPR